MSEVSPAKDFGTEPSYNIIDGTEMGYNMACLTAASSTVIRHVKIISSLVICLDRFMRR